MRILLLSQWFDPEPHLKGLAFARALQQRGHEVEVLTGFPNYPTGKVYPGYRVRPWQRESVEGIRVNRVALYPSHDRSGVRRAASYGSFAASAAALGPWLVRKPDVVHVYNLVTLAPACLALRLLKGCPFVLDVQDLWPDSVADSGMLGYPLCLRALGTWCRFAYRRAAHLAVQSPGIRNELARRGIPAGKMSVVPNYCDEASMRPAPRDPELARALGLEGRFVVLFAGTMGIAQGLETVLEAAALVRDSLPDVCLALMGAGVQRDVLERQAREAGLVNVRFLPARPAQEMAPALALADALLVHLKDSPLHRITVPSKTQAYLAAGRPIVMAVAGDAADLVSRASAGILCRPGDAGALAEAIARMRALAPSERERMGQAGARFYREELSLERSVERFESIFTAAACRKRSE